MKKIISILFIISMVFIGCNEDTMLREASTPSFPNTNTKSVTLTPTEAVALAQRAADKLFPSKSRNSSRTAALENVKTIRTQSSRANGSDTLMYVVNYNDEAGYALIGARRDRKNVLAVIDKGSYDPEIGSDNPGLNLFLGAAETYLNDNYEPEDTIPEDTTIYDEVYPSHERWDTITNEMVYPKLNGMAWGQGSKYGSIYSRYCPNKIAGCVPVAIGMIKTYIRKKYNGTTTESFNFPERPYSTATINWHELFAHKSNLNCYESNTEYTHTAIGAILRQIGKNANASYTTESTGVTTTNAKKEIGRQFSDQNVSGLTDFNFYTIKYALQSGIVYMQGSNTQSDTGHAWVADGVKYLVVNYYFEPWNPATNRFDKWLPETSTYRYLHCCWGWEGLDDGWFEGSVFRTSQKTYNNVKFISICPK